MPSSSSLPGNTQMTGLLRSSLASLLAEARFFANALRWIPLWLLVLLSMGVAVAIYQTPHAYTVLVGAPQDQAYTRNFHTRLEENGQLYRWSDVYGYVLFPGVGGSRPFTVSTTLDPGRAATVSIFINGEPFVQRRLNQGWQTLTFHVDGTRPAALASRDTVVEFRAPDYRSEDAPSEPKGVKVSSVRVEQASVGGFIVPSVATLLYSGISILMVYILAARLLRGVSTMPSIRWRALVAASIVAGGIGLGLILDRMAFSAAATHIVVTLGSSLVLFMLVEKLVGKLRPGEDPREARLLASCVAAGFALRYGGMALPQSVIIDMPYHMKWLRTLLAGDWQALYFPGGLSEVPREWGMSLLIPKSPLFYLVFAPVGTIPVELETLVKWLICMLDSSLVALVYWFTVRVSGSSKAALLSAAIYATMPLAFRAFAYGVLPTIFAQWLAALLLASVLVVANNRWNLTAWAGLLALAALSLLAFPTVAVFLTLILCVVPLVWRKPRNLPGGAAVQWRVYPLLAGAWLVSICLYYGLYILPVVASARAMLAPTQGGGTTVHWPDGVPELLGWTADYVVSLLPAMLAMVGILLLISRRAPYSMQRQAFGLVVVWLAIAPLFIAANYRVDMIGKHLFFTMLPVAVVAGVTLWAMVRKGPWGVRLCALLIAAVGWQAIVFWIERLVRASS